MTCIRCTDTHTSPRYRTYTRETVEAGSSPPSRARARPRGPSAWAMFGERAHARCPIDGGRLRPRPQERPRDIGWAAQGLAAPYLPQWGPPCQRLQSPQLLVERHGQGARAPGRPGSHPCWALQGTRPPRLGLKHPSNLPAAPKLGLSWAARETAVGWGAMQSRCRNEGVSLPLPNLARAACPWPRGRSPTDGYGPVYIRER